MAVEDELALLKTLDKVKQKFDIKTVYKYTPKLNVLEIVVSCPADREVIIAIEKPSLYDFESESFVEYIQHSILKFWLSSLQRP